MAEASCKTHSDLPRETGEVFRKNNQRLLPRKEIHFGDNQFPKLAPDEAARFEGTLLRLLERTGMSEDLRLVFAEAAVQNLKSRFQKKLCPTEPRKQMDMRKFIFCLWMAGTFFLPPVRAVFACDSCGCALARISSEGKLSQTEKPVFFDFSFEQQVWHKRDPQLARNLGAAGHDTHDKTTEEFYHFGLGANFPEWFSVFADLPYIVRHDLNVEPFDNTVPGAVDHLGERRASHGFGDLSLSGILKLLKKAHNFIGPLAGIKFPTGVTDNKTPEGDKFAPEMQPGSGSFDPSLGTAFAYQIGRVAVHGNAIYMIRKRGAQNFRFGNLFSTYFFIDYLLNPKSKYFRSKVGIDVSLQNEQKQTGRDGRVADSGGTTLLLGPEFSIRENDYVSIFGNLLFPAVQELGGVHQRVQFIWNAGVKISL